MGERLVSHRSEVRSNRAQHDKARPIWRGLMSFLSIYRIFSDLETDSMAVKTSSVEIDDEVRKDMSPIGVRLLDEIYSEYGQSDKHYRIEYASEDQLSQDDPEPS